MFHSYSDYTTITIMKKYYILSAFIFFIFQMTFGQSGSINGTVLESETRQPLEAVSIYVTQKGNQFTSTSNGLFSIENLKAGSYELVFYKEEYLTQTQIIVLKDHESLHLTFYLEKLSYDLETIEVEAEKREKYGIRRLRNVEGTAIYATKKNEVINLENTVANLATNNARQVYKGIAGLNIWESDGAGLQLSIGARGLDPNRTSNFNTRQNGYDISADALGYPESYYTPPTQALQRIEIVRGAASLQYGSQFGGLLNFVFKKGPKKKPFEFFSENTIGSFGLFNSFNSIGGSKGDWNYYAFYQRKQGDGWRPNAEFNQNTAFVNISRNFSDKLKIGVEYTYMNYLAQQPGGLQDFEFQQNPRQSKRSRNWFKVNWNLAALNIDYRINDKTKINSKSFLLDAQRDALGELGPINRPDPLRERDLIRGKFENFGNETRLITRYQLKNQWSTLLLGFRYYQGYTTNQQGDASDGSGADFTFLNPGDLERSEYEFPSRNISFFAENLFNLHSKWTITPGLRFEYIRTASDGFYKERVFSGGQLIFEQKFDDAKENKRQILLLGLGTGYKLSKGIEAYANFSQNYRSINFSDLALVNPNLLIDSTLTDEKGFNADFGVRGTLFKETVNFDFSTFYLRYQNRIGLSEIIISDPTGIEKAVAFRTNVGDARMVGMEAYIEADVLKIQKINPPSFSCTVFTNISLLHGKYLSGENGIVGNKVELIPPVNIKTGLNFRWKDLKASYQFSFVGSHFSDATNAEFVVDATRGRIPSYQVQDFSVSYVLNRFRFQSGINNLLDKRYFTRRAVAYPGPGIIPSDGRSFYVSVAVRL